MTKETPDEAWIVAQRRASAQVLRDAVSATHLSHRRDNLGWTVRPAPGSILASTRQANWNPEPDYFHHWVRDAAIALRAVPLAMEAAPHDREFWQRAIAEHVDFSLAITDPHRSGPRNNPLRGGTKADHLKFLRPDTELAALSGRAWLEEPRFAADGSVDLERWNRPQDDGPSLRASALMYLTDTIPEIGNPKTDALIERDLDHLKHIAGRPSIGPWEETPARRSSFTLIAQWDALDRGSRRLGKRDHSLRDAAHKVRVLMEEAHDDQTDGWRESVEAPAGQLDSATVLAILHAGRQNGPFARSARRTRATVAGLERVFSELYEVSRDWSVPAIGRFANDVYFGGNPWFPTTLGFAELHYWIAIDTAEKATFTKAEAWMGLIQNVAPKPVGPLPEQFDRISGAPVSCRSLTWSAAAFLEAAAARDAARQAFAGAR